MSKHDDRRRSRAAFNIALKPFKLLGTEIAETARLKIDDIDQADEVNAVGVEAVPAGALGDPTIALAIDLLIRVKKIMLAGT